jgi:hypothetical protein
MKKQLFALGFMLVAGAVTAQTAPVQPVAKIVSTEGLVTVGYQDSMRSAANNMGLFEGTSVMTTTTGVVEIVFNSGCRVTLRPGEVFNVSEASCRALVASRAASQSLAGGSLPAGANAALLGTAAVGLGILVSGSKQSGS